jgi:hypothetical protein
MKRTGPDRVQAVEVKRPRPAMNENRRQSAVEVTIAGAAEFDDAAVAAVERLMEIGREVDARMRRERGCTS